MDFDVVGTFQSFSKEFDARAVRVPLAAAQELMGTNGANALVVSLKETQRHHRRGVSVEEGIGQSTIRSQDLDGTECIL